MKLSGEKIVPILVQHRQIVLPGQLLAEGKDAEVKAQYTIYRIGDKYYSSVIGLADVQNGRRLSVIALEGFYFPKTDDIVVGMIIDIGLTSWTVDIRSPYLAILHASDVLSKPFNPLKDNLRKYLDIGDLVLAKITQFDRTRSPVLTVKGKGLGKITKGVIVEIIPSRVPRVIGRKGSMINMVKEETKCQITIGLNGRIWITGPTPMHEEVAILAIKKIERETHTSGLTDRVKAFIREEFKKRGLAT